MEQNGNPSSRVAAWLAAGNRPSRGVRSTSRLNDCEKPVQPFNKFNVREKDGANATASSSTDRLNANLEPSTFNQWVERLNATFAALADPTRRVMLMMLRDGERSVGDLARPHAMSFAAAARHVQVLERAGLIERRRAGRRQMCRLRADPLREAYLSLGRWESFWARPDA